MRHGLWQWNMAFMNVFPLFCRPFSLMFACYFLSETTKRHAKQVWGNCHCACSWVCCRRFANDWVVAGNRRDDWWYAKLWTPHAGRMWLSPVSKCRLMRADRLQPPSPPSIAFYLEAGPSFHNRTSSNGWSFPKTRNHKNIRPSLFVVTVFLDETKKSLHQNNPFISWFLDHLILFCMRYLDFQPLVFTISHAINK